jgi:glutathione peroxidase
MSFSNPSDTDSADRGETNIHSHTLSSLYGEEVDLSEYRGKVLLVVNTASKCGYTKQYEGLQALHENYKEKDLVILGFPSADFGGQEYSDDEDIAEFCERNFGVSFPMFSRISVKGSDQHELFRQLTTAENQDFTGDINWNFEKFLIDEEGRLVRRFRSNVTPQSNELTSSIDSLLES